MKTSQESVRTQRDALTSRMDVLEEMLDKIDAAVMVDLRQTEARLETEQEPWETEVKTDMEGASVKSLTKRLQRRLWEPWKIDLRTRGWPYDTEAQ
jgi:hypothetical protein